MARPSDGAGDERMAGVREGLWGIGVVLAAALPFLPGLLRGQSLYFRDLSTYFFPLRRFMGDGLARGELRFWNPLVHEGRPELFPPVLYPLDVLQAFVSSEWGLSVLLLLHVPLAGFLFFRMMRDLGALPAASAGAGVLYALGGFMLSIVSFYDFIETAAWAPGLCLALRRAVQRSGAWGAVAAVAVMLTVAPGRPEVAAQALLIGAVIAWPTTRSGFARLAMSIALGLGLAAPLFVVQNAAALDSPRHAGLAAAAVLSDSIHPASLLQTVIGDLHGDLSNLVGRFWGERFWSRGFPLFLSFYVGPTALCLAALGITRTPRRWPLVVLAVLAIWVAMGEHAGWTPIVESLPAALRTFRYPSKAFFTVHFLLALLAGFGLHALAEDDGPRRRRFARVAMALGILMCALPAAALAIPEARAARLFPGSSAPHAIAAHVAADGARGGAACLSAGIVAWILGRRRSTGSRVAAIVACLLCLDLLRTGAGLNPMVTPAFFDLSGEMRVEVDRLRASDATIYTCSAPESAAFLAARPRQSDHLDVWTTMVLMETMSGLSNMRWQVRSAFGDDLADQVSAERKLSRAERLCRSVPSVMNRLRRAGVTHVLSLDSIEHPKLRLISVVGPRRIAPLRIHVYALEDPRARVFVTQHIEEGHRRDAATDVVVMEAAGTAGTVDARRQHAGEWRIDANAAGPAVLVVRESFAPGWTATVDGIESEVLRADGRHLAVRLPAGPSRVALSYSPPGLGLALASMALAAAAALAMWRSSGVASTHRGRWLPSSNGAEDR